MKSRNFTNSHTTNTCGEGAQGLLMARSPRAIAARDAAVRRFELKHNSSPRFARRRQERRQGQALLLAVLIMLLAALLGAGFLAVVSGNLNQSARIADKTRAIEASRAGIAYANAQLSGSSQGDLWRPVDVNPAPDPNAPEDQAIYNDYYSQLDKVQGWANRLPKTDPLYRETAYGKFPDPNQALGDAPKFLVKVEELPLTLPTSNPEYIHRGEIKITSIGLSEDDPNVFHRSVAYKIGRKKSPWSSALRSISNWKFGENNTAAGVPYGEVTTAAAAGATSATPVTNVDVQINTLVDNKNAPLFSPADVPFNVVIVTKGATSSVRGAVVTDVTGVTGTTATLKLAKVEAPITPAPDTTIVIQKAAAIGTGSTIDLLNTGQPVAALPAAYSVFPTQSQPNGILVNGSTWLQGQIELSNLSMNGTKLFTTGSLAIDSGTKPLIASGDITTGGDILPSDANTGPNQFPGTFVTASGVQQTDLINDGWNKIGAQTLGLNYSTSRNVEPFTPVKIDSAENLARYRALTRNSDTNSDGYQLGVYIDNRDDVEKVGTAAMTQKQLVEMLTVPTSSANYSRNDAASTAATGVSLEQRHLRGWVGNDEFLARGALVEITNDAYPTLGITAPSLRVTLDARSDATPTGPDANKSWRNADGTTAAGVYTRVLPFPDNGTIFAEGNIRIRGDVRSGTPAPRSLTVVSLGNIYIEGSLSIDNTYSTGTTPDPNRKKLMLLAKKNVIVNPTRAVLARTDVQTVADIAAPLTRTVASPPTFDLPVRNAYPFKVGDYVTVQATPTDIRGVVTTVTDNTQLSIRTPDLGVIAPNAIVRSPLEKRDVDDDTNVKAVFSVVDTDNAINRRIMVAVAQGTSGSTTNRNNKLVFDHVADKATTTVGINIKAENTLAGLARPTGFTATLTDKQPLDAGPPATNDPREKSIVSGNKRLRTYNNNPFTGGTQEHTFVMSGAKTIDLLAGEISLVTQNDGGMPPVNGYRYIATPTSPAVGALPSYTLAGAGLRYDPNATVFTAPPPPNPANNNRKDFNTTEGYTVPLATSVEFALNGNVADFGTIGETRTIRYVGFNPVFGTSDDALTIDGSFYQLKTEIATKSTLDLRPLTLPIVGAPAAGFTSFPNSVVLKRSNAFSDTLRSRLLPDYRVKAMKVESYDSVNDDIKPAGGTMNINAYVYAQEGSWFVIPGDYFRPNSPVRAEIDGSGNFIGSYLDYDNDGNPDANEYIEETVGGVTRKVADLNRNGIADTGEYQAAVHLTRYNTVKIEFFGSIVENQTAVVADVTVPGATPVVVQKGAVQDWMDKWVSYNDSTNGPILPPTGSSPGVTGAKNNFSFISYSYDPSIANGNIGANQLRVPVTDDLLYEQ